MFVVRRRCCAALLPTTGAGEMRATAWGHAGGEYIVQKLIRDQQRTLRQVAGALGGATQGAGRNGERPSRPAATGGTWACRHADCRFATKGLLNFAERRLCGGCGRTKTVALSPPASGAIQGAGATAEKAEGDTLAAVQAKKEKRDRKKQAREQRKAKCVGSASTATGVASQAARPPAPAAPGPVSQAMAATLVLADGAAATAISRPALPKELLDQSQLLESVVKAVTSSLAQESMPPLGDPKRAEIVVNDFLGSKDPALKEERKVQQAGLVAKLKVAVAALEAGGDATKDALTGVQASLAAAEAQLAKFEKETPSTGYDVKAVKNAKAAFELALQRKRGNALAGAARAAERHVARAKIFQDARDQLARLEAGTLEVEKQCAQAHAARTGAAAAVDQEVARLFEAKIAKCNADDAAAQVARAVEVSVSNDAVMPQAPPAAVLDAQPLDPLQQAQQDVKKAQEALAAAQLAHTADLKQKEEAHARAVQAAAVAPNLPHLVTFVCEQSDLPQAIAKPEGQQWQELHYLWAGLEALQRQEALQGYQVPVTFAQLRAGLDTPALVLGQALWAKAFPAGPPTPEAVVTVQVRMLLQLSLEVHRQALCEEQARQQQAREEIKTSIEEAVEEYRGKRQRT